MNQSIIDKDIKIKNVLKIAIELMLNEIELVTGGYISKISISRTYIQIYVNDDFKPLPNKLVEDDNLNRNSTDIFVSRYPRILLKEPENNKQGRKYVIADLDNQTNSLDIIKKVIYIDKSEESEMDPRTDMEKMANYQTEETIDMMVHLMLTKGYSYGMLTELDKAVYGRKEGQTTYAKLGTDDTAKLDLELKKELSFKKLNKPLREKSLRGSNVVFLETRNKKNIKLEQGLKNVLKNKYRGLIILDKVITSDLLCSELYDDNSIRPIHVISGTIAYNNPLLVITNEGTGELSPNIVNELSKGDFSFIMDTEGRLSLQQIIELSQQQLVVINKPLDNIKTTFSQMKLALNNDNLYNQLINNIQYMGSIYTRTGLVLTGTSRHLLKTDNFESFGEVTEVSSQLKRLLLYLYSEKIQTFEIVNGRSKVITNNNEEKDLILNGEIVTVNTSQILNFLWKITDKYPEEQERMIRSLDEERNFTTIYKSESYTQDGRQLTQLLRITVIKTEGANMDLMATVLPQPIIRTYISQIEKPYVELVGLTSKEQTSLIKGQIHHNHKDKIMLIYDKEFTFDVREYEDVSKIILIREENYINKGMLQNLNPDIVILNSEVSWEKIMIILKNINRNTKMYINSEYPMDKLYQEMKDKSYQERKCYDKLKENIHSIDLNQDDLFDIIETEVNIMDLNPDKYTSNNFNQIPTKEVSLKEVSSKEISTNSNLVSIKSNRDHVNKYNSTVKGEPIEIHQSTMDLSDKNSFELYESLQGVIDINESNKYGSKDELYSRLNANISNVSYEENEETKNQDDMRSERYTVDDFGNLINSQPDVTSKQIKRPYRTPQTTIPQQYDQPLRLSNINKNEDTNIRILNELNEETSSKVITENKEDLISKLEEDSYGMQDPEELEIFSTEYISKTLIEDEEIAITSEDIDRSSIVDLDDLEIFSTDYLSKTIDTNERDLSEDITALIINEEKEDKDFISSKQEGSNYQDFEDLSESDLEDIELISREIMENTNQTHEILSKDIDKSVDDSIINEDVSNDFMYDDEDEDITSFMDYISRPQNK